MIERLKKLLQENPSVSDWKLNIEKKESSELFYVGKKLETNRAADVISYTLTVYTDKGEERGLSAFTVYPYMTDAELSEKIQENVFAASFAMNPYYDLPSGKDAVLPESRSNLREMTLKDAAEIVSDAVFAADRYDGGLLSATEIFLDRYDQRILNSRGVDLQAVTWLGSVELIPSWEKDGEEVEIYHMLKFESIDASEITAKVDEQLKIAAARFEAKPLGEVIDLATPVRVILQDEETKEVLSYFAEALTYEAKYHQQNLYEIGDPVQGDEVKGTVLNATMVPYCKGAFQSSFFDADGVILKETPIIKDGVAVSLFGSYRFGRYLGETEPSGLLPILKVMPGTKPFSEMAKAPYLRCAVFSGIQVQAFSGYFGGEVRLGFYFDGEKEIPVTGFSISGDMKQSRSTMIYSSDETVLGAYQGPKYLEICDMKLL